MTMRVLATKFVLGSGKRSMAFAPVALIGGGQG